MKKHDDFKHETIVCDFQKDDVGILGGGTCPFCGKRTELVNWNGRLAISSDKKFRCSHAIEILQGGGLDVVMHFAKEKLCMSFTDKIKQIEEDLRSDDKIKRADARNELMRMAILADQNSPEFELPAEMKDAEERN